jgi:two-component system OmpR family sensor kinase
MKLRDAELEAGALGKSIVLCQIGEVFVHGNLELVRRGVENVLRNAVRYEPVGGSIEVSVRPHGGGVTIAVRDHGRGVPHADLKRIFEAFYRVDEARERSRGGTRTGAYDRSSGHGTTWRPCAG